MKRHLVTLALLFIPSVAYSQVHVRVIDVGAGLCCVITLPDADGDNKPEYAIIDAGFGSNKTMDKIKELIPENEDTRLAIKERRTA